MVFDSVVFALTVYRTLSIGGGRLASLLLRDGTFKSRHNRSIHRVLSPIRVAVLCVCLHLISIQDGDLISHTISALFCVNLGNILTLLARSRSRRGYLAHLMHNILAGLGVAQS